jgi:hypothetical protein
MSKAPVTDPLAKPVEAASFTPGPWRNDGRSIYALVQDGWRRGEPLMVNRFYVHVQCGSGRVSATPDELDANARLIAAAPDLLVALEAVLLDCENAAEVVLGEASYKKAYAAIKKARGQ